MRKRNYKFQKAWMVLIALSALVLQGQSNPPGTKIYFPIMFNNWTPAPLYATSYYIQNGDPAYMYDLGCRLGTRDAATPGQQDSLVILDFAQMWVENSQYGALGFEDPFNAGVWHFRSYAQLQESAQFFAKGYWACSANDDISQLTIGVGTNSFGFFNQTNRTEANLKVLAADFGRNWAYMINNLNTWARQNGYSSQVLFTGAIDIEWSARENNDGLRLWQSSAIVKSWVNAFDTKDNNVSIFFNYGACVGCYETLDPNWKYITPDYWNIDDVWFVSWGSKPAYAVPEIYSNNGTLARQWAVISEYGAKYKASRIVFSGVMTQMQACWQRAGSDPSCASLDNTPDEGWQQLVYAVNSSVYTISPSPRWVTDIKWQFK
ncbi:MAG: hypothetical protein ACYC6H_04890 [Bellilinea sp.]